MGTGGGDSEATPIVNFELTPVYAGGFPHLNINNFTHLCLHCLLTHSKA